MRDEFTTRQYSNIVVDKKQMDQCIYINHCLFIGQNNVKFWDELISVGDLRLISLSYLRNFFIQVYINKIITIEKFN